MRLKHIIPLAAALLISAAGAGAQVNPNPASDDLDPVWSPDGGAIAFVSSRAGSYDIYVMRPNGTGVRQLTDHPEWDSNPSWSPDGRQIAFSSRRTGGGDIYVINADGSNLRQLTSSQSVETSPEWSPNGEQISFTRFENEPERRFFNSAAMVINADGTDERRIADPFWNGSAEDFAMRMLWSPDGAQIAVTYYVSYSGDTSECMNDGNLYLANSKTGTIEQVINLGGGGAFSLVQWLSDGSMIVYKRIGDQCITSLDQGWYRLDVSARTVRQIDIALGTGFATDSLRAAPDNERIAYLNYLDEGGLEVVLSDLSGINRESLLRTRINSNPFGVDWSPNGQRIVTSLCTDFDADIYLIDLTTNTSANLTANAPISPTSDLRSECGTLG